MFLQELANRLAAVAEDLHKMLDPNTEQLHGVQTIIHGDFKTANLFFTPNAGDQSALHCTQVLGSQHLLSLTAAPPQTL